VTNAPRHARRLVIIEAAAALAREARAAAGASLAGSPDWQFYRGVEDAALHVLRPEIAAVREDASWLEREDPSFRDGFLEGQLLLAAAATPAEPPVRLPLPVRRPARPVGEPTVR
jgi:hypothetical protein